MTKTLVALVLVAGGILLVTRLVDTDKPVPARLRRLRTRTKSRKLDTSRRVCRPATFVILSTPGRSAPFRNQISWLSIQRSPHKPPPQAFATSSSSPSGV